MEQRITKKLNGRPSWPASTKRRVEVASYEHYRKMNVRSVQGLIENRNDIATLREIIDNREDGTEVVVAIFAKSLNMIKAMTNVKNWLEPEAVRLFIEEVLGRYAKPDITEIQLTPVDIQIFCRKVALGEYGEMYENVSVTKLMIWLEEYVNERVRTVQAHRQRIQMKQRRESEHEIDPEGLRRIAKAFEKIHRKHIAKREKITPKYHSIQDYIERNDVDVVEFWNEREKEFNEWMKNVVASSDTNIQPEDIGDETIKAFERMYLTKWIHKQNELIQ